MNIHLDFHSMVQLVSVDTTPSMERYFNQSLSRFIKQSKCSEHEADVVVQPISLEHSLMSNIAELTPHHNKIFLNIENKTVVYFFYRNKIDYIIVFDQQIKFFYLPSKNIHKRIDSIINFCLDLQLAKKDSLICYGAVLVKQDRCLLLVGSPMTGKTMTALSLLSNGWDFVSDNKFILSKGRAYLCEDTIAMRPHFHFKHFPSLQNNTPSFPKVEMKFKIKSLLVKKAYQYMPRQLLPLLDEFAAFRQYHKVPVNVVFPKAKSVDSAKITDVLVVSQGKETRSDHSCLEDCIRDMAVIQNMLIRDLSLFEDLLFLTNNALTIEVKNILSCNLDTAKFHRVTKTIGADIKQVTALLNQFLV